MTEGYIWTGQFPEAQRIVDKGNNQSMELDKKRTSGIWTKNDKGQRGFFILNESNIFIIGKIAAFSQSGFPINSPDSSPILVLYFPSLISIVSPFIFSGFLKITFILPSAKREKLHL